MSYQENNPNYGKQSSTLAVISLISGIASFFIIPLLGAIAAIITGGMAKKEIRRSGGLMTGIKMANWGVILGWINIAISFGGICLLILALLGVFGSVAFCAPFSNMNW